MMKYVNVFILLVATAFYSYSQEIGEKNISYIMNSLLVDQESIIISIDSIDNNLIKGTDKINFSVGEKLSRIKVPKGEGKSVYLLHLNSDSYFDLFALFSLDYFESEKSIELINQGICCNLNHLLVYLLKDKKNNSLFSLDSTISICIDKNNSLELSGFSSEFIYDTITQIDYNSFLPLISGTGIYCSDIPVENYCIYSYCPEKSKLDYVKYIISSDNNERFIKMTYNKILRKFSNIELIKEKEQVSSKNLCGACFCKPGIVRIFDW